MYYIVDTANMIHSGGQPATEEHIHTYIERLIVVLWMLPRG